MPRIRTQFLGERFDDKTAAIARRRELRAEGKKTAFTEAEIDGELAYFVNVLED